MAKVKLSFLDEKFQIILTPSNITNSKSDNNLYIEAASNHHYDEQILAIFGSYLNRKLYNSDEFEIDGYRLKLQINANGEQKQINFGSQGSRLYDLITNKNGFCNLKSTYVLEIDAINNRINVYEFVNDIEQFSMFLNQETSPRTGDFFSDSTKKAYLRNISILFESYKLYFAIGKQELIKNRPEFPQLNRNHNEFSAAISIYSRFKLFENGKFYFSQEDIEKILLLQKYSYKLHLYEQNCTYLHEEMLEELKKIDFDALLERYTFDDDKIKFVRYKIIEILKQNKPLTTELIKEETINYKQYKNNVFFTLMGIYYYGNKLDVLENEVREIFYNLYKANENFFENRDFFCKKFGFLGNQNYGCSYAAISFYNGKWFPGSTDQICIDYSHNIESGYINVCHYNNGKYSLYESPNIKIELGCESAILREMQQVDAILNREPKSFIGSAGENNKYFEDFINGGFFGLNWNIKDLEHYSTKEEIVANNQDISESVAYMHMLLKNLSLGDIIYLRNGLSKFVAKGIVTSPYKYCDDLNANRINVSWQTFEQIDIGRNIFTRNSLYKASEEVVIVLELLLNGGDYMKMKFKPQQKIYIGPPGSGKSYLCRDLVNVTRIVFHPEYENSDFIGSLLPVDSDGKIKYTFVPGPFTKILEKALHNREAQYNLLIEEMTRGNCAAIFGEIFQLLDRDENGNSQYAINNDAIQDYLKIDSIYLPNNLNIIGTVNSSDQNVFPMDTAFKRRFELVYVKPIEDGYEENDFLIMGYKWSDLCRNINKLICDNEHLAEDKQIGFYFIKKAQTSEQELANIQKLCIYLWHDVDKFIHEVNFKLLNHRQYNNYGDFTTNVLIDNVTIDQVFSQELVKLVKNTITGYDGD